MTNTKQLKLLKKDVQAWNSWRAKNPDVEVDLNGANFIEADLTEASFNGSELENANLKWAHLWRARLSAANLRNADLTEAELMGATLKGADLTLADLSRANLTGADLSVASLSRANFNGADLRGVDINGAKLIGTNFQGAEVVSTVFANVDLSQAVNLDHVYHNGPSSISTDTFILSKGKIPTIFLRGCGLSNWEIEHVKLYNPDLSNEEITQIQYKFYELRATQALQISPLFISYSHANSEFVDKVGDRLTEKGIRFWRDIHDMKSGRIEKQIDRAIHQNPTVLLVLSEHSLSSDWVEHEVRTARELEKELKRDTLCPIALDDSWKDSKWPKRITEQIMEYNILDFSEWEDDVKFERMFCKLIDGLELFYKA